MIPLFSCFSCVAYSEGPPVYLETSLVLWAVWSQFCVRYSLVPACICSQSLQLPLKCTVSNWRILICHTCPFEAVLSSFVCLGWPPVLASLSSVSDLWPDPRGWKWPLIQAHLLSCAVDREGRCKQAPLACVGALAMDGSHGVATAQGSMHLPDPSSWGSLVCCESTVPGGLCISSGELVSGVTLLADMNCPGSQEGVVSDWQPTHNWWEMQSLGPSLQWPLAFHLWLSCTCLSASKEGCKWQLTHPCLVFARAGSFVLWACQGSQCSSRAFPQESSFVFLCFPGVPKVGVFLVLSVLCHINLLSVLTAFKPCPFSKDQRCSTCSAPSPHSLWVGREHVSLFLVIAFRQFLWWNFSVMLPSEVPKLPTDPTCERVSYCVETSPP